MNPNNFMMVSTTTIRNVYIFDGKDSYSVDIDLDVPFEEIIINANEQLEEKK